MKAVILAGGLGTRLSEETGLKPKPMVEIGGLPILWHIMKIYSHHGVNEFVICCGYKGNVIKEYFKNYYINTSDVTYNLESGEYTINTSRAEQWKVTLVDTGSDTMTGGRLKRVLEYVKDEELFCFTYGDGVSNIDVTASINFHKSHKKKATITAVYPPGRFGALEMKDGVVLSFKEKPKGDGSMINGGFFVLSPDVIDKIPDDKCIWEDGPLSELSQEGELMAFLHHGFWHPMDSLHDKVKLNKMWADNLSPWKIWD
jgi:glucose-1-phosphate cytidylyltransferase